MPTKIGFKDFFPTVLKSGFFSSEHEELSDTVKRASDWVLEAKVDVINIETVVLPNISSEEDSSQVGIRTSGKYSSEWYQVVRLWYKE